MCTKRSHRTLSKSIMFTATVLVGLVCIGSPATAVPTAPTSQGLVSTASEDDQSSAVEPQTGFEEEPVIEVRPPSREEQHLSDDESSMQDAGESRSNRGLEHESASPYVPEVQAAELEDLVPDLEDGIAIFEMAESEVVQGGSLQVSGQCALFGYEPYEGRVSISREDFYLRTHLTLDASGKFSESILIPKDAPVGEHWVTFICIDHDMIYGSFDRTLTVLKGDFPTPPSNSGGNSSSNTGQPNQLAATGFNGAGLLLASAALLACGGVLAFLGSSTRRRRHR